MLAVISIQKTMTFANKIRGQDKNDEPDEIFLIVQMLMWTGRLDFLRPFVPCLGPLLPTGT